MVYAAPYTLIGSFSVEGYLLGINCVLYAFCVYTLWDQKSISFRLLLLVNTIQFLLCAVQTTLHTVLYFTAFTVLMGDFQPYLQHVNVYIVGPTVIFNVNFITAGFLSIWRLFVLYDRKIWVCIPAFILWIAQICMSGITIHICATTPVASMTFSPFNESLWALITALNFCIAVPIAMRLCVVQKKIDTILNPSPYKSAAIVLVECGALITAISVAMTILYACNYTYALVSIGVATEVAIASQLLLTARQGMLAQERPTTSEIPPVHEVNVTRAESRPSNSSTPLAKEKPFCSFVEPKSKDKPSLDSA